MVCSWITVVPRLRAAAAALPQFRCKETGKFSNRVRAVQGEFADMRPYAVGDDIRSIDWKASARKQDLTVRTYYEEEGSALMIVVDVSASMAPYYEALKMAVATLVAAACVTKWQLAFVAYSNTLEFGCARGRAEKVGAHIDHFFATHVPKGTTDARCIRSFITRAVSQRTALWCITDGFDVHLAALFAAVGKTHPVIMTRLGLPQVALPVPVVLTAQDPETGRKALFTLREGDLQQEHAFAGVLETFVAVTHEADYVQQMIECLRKVKNNERRRTTF